MIYPAPHSMSRCSLACITAILIMLGMAISAIAAVSLGPKVKDAANEEHRRSLQFLEAQRSLQKKLEVGQARDERRQGARAKAIQAMAAELTNRQKTVVIRPVAASYVRRNRTGGQGFRWYWRGSGQESWVSWVSNATEAASVKAGEWFSGVSNENQPQRSSTSHAASQRRPAICRVICYESLQQQDGDPTL